MGFSLFQLVIHSLSINAVSRDRKEGNVLFNMASDIWQRTTQVAREETRYRHIGYSS